MNYPIDPQEAAESDAIRADIDETREAMDHTIDDIGERMKPRYLFGDFFRLFRSRRRRAREARRLEGRPGRMGAAISSAGSAAGKVTTSVASTVREHPLPALLIGAGLALAWYEFRQRDRGNGHGRFDWREGDEDFDDEMSESEFAAATGSSSESGSMKESIKNKMAAAGEQLQDKTQRVRERMAEHTHNLGAKASELRGKVAEGAKRRYAAGRDKFIETKEENPLCIAAGFLAVGILAGLALPASYKEDEWVGRVADRIKYRAKVKGQDLYERGKKVMSAAAEAARKSAAQEGLTRSGGSEKQFTPTGEQQYKPLPGQGPAQS